MTPHAAFQSLADGMNRAVLGQETVVERLLVALLADGHVLMEGLPGTAKTRSIKTLSKLMEADFGRVQFTPDLLPSDGCSSANAKGSSRFRRFGRGSKRAEVTPAIPNHSPRYPNRFRS